MNSQNSWTLLPQNYLYKVHRNTQKRYCLNLTKQQLHEYKSQKKILHIIWFIKIIIIWFIIWFIKITTANNLNTTNTRSPENNFSNTC